MSGVKVHVDMRTYTAKVRQLIQNKYIESVNTPGVKSEIYMELYDMIADTIPEDTGALKYSPLTEGTATFMDYGTTSRQPHYAMGEINDKGIFFNPYSVSNKTGKVYDYASNVRGFQPYRAINDRKSLAYNRIKDIIVREMNDG